MIDLSVFKDKNIAVMGLGKTGLSVVAALTKAGAKISVWDDREESRAGLKDQSVLVDLNDADFSQFDMLVLSPGIPHSLPAPHKVAQNAIDHVVPIVCDVELLCQAQPEMPIVSITGTNGKSTTTSLIGHILGEDRKIDVGGNLGQPVLDFKTRGMKSYVVELSSYQLERCPNLSPQVAVWLNITPDHIDRHGDLEGYISAKKNMFKKPREGSVAVIGVDDEHSRKVADDLERQGQWRVCRVSVQDELEDGYFIRDGHLIHRVPAAEGQEDGAEESVLIDLRGLVTLKGVHNRQNAACAYAACHAMGVPHDMIIAQMQSFPGLEHRQYVADVLDGIAYVNDSKATNASAASMALRSFDTIYWIVGGRPKEGGLDGLDEYIGRIAHAFLIGEAQDDFAQWMRERGVEYSICGNLETAVPAAHDMAQGDKGLPGAGAAVVLLSPACASFDQFPSYEARGDHFVELVGALK